MHVDVDVPELGDHAREDVVVEGGRHDDDRVDVLARTTSDLTSEPDTGNIGPTEVQDSLSACEDARQPMGPESLGLVAPRIRMMSAASGLEPTIRVGLRERPYGRRARTIESEGARPPMKTTQVPSTEATRRAKGQGA